MWVANLDDKTLSRIDAATHDLVRTITLDATPTGVAVGLGSVWVANGLVGTVVRVDTTTNEPVEPIEVTFRSNAGTVAVGEGAVWAAFGTGEVGRIDSFVVRGLARRRGELSVRGHGRRGVRLGRECLRPLGLADEPEDRERRRADHGRTPAEWRRARGRVLVGLERGRRQRAPDRHGVELDHRDHPRGRRAHRYRLRAGSVWVANGADGTLSRIDPRTNRVANILVVGNRPSGIAVGADGIWVTFQAPLD